MPWNERNRGQESAGTFFGEQQAHFRQRLPVLKLVEFEKSEILNDSLQLLSRFYVIARGSVSIYNLTEDGSIRYISKAASGTLLEDMEFSGAGNQSFYIEAAETVLLLSVVLLGVFAVGAYPMLRHVQEGGVVVGADLLQRLLVLAVFIAGVVEK